MTIAILAIFAWVTYRRIAAGGLGPINQSGTITGAGSQAVFHDDSGHTVTFQARPDATSFLQTCS